MRSLAGQVVSDGGSCDNSIVCSVGKVRCFFLYSYIIDPFYLLVVNYCCYLVCLKIPECWASVYMCTPSPTCPPPWEDGGLQWPRSQKSFPLFCFQILCSMFGEGKVGVPKWLMYCSPSFCPALPTPLLCSLWSPEHFFQGQTGLFFF